MHVNLENRVEAKEPLTFDFVIKYLQGRGIVRKRKTNGGYYVVMGFEEDRSHPMSRYRTNLNKLAALNEMYQDKIGMDIVVLTPVGSTVLVTPNADAVAEINRRRSKRIFYQIGDKTKQKNTGKTEENIANDFKKVSKLISKVFNANIILNSNLKNDYKISGNSIEISKNAIYKDTSLLLTNIIKREILNNEKYKEYKEQEKDLVKIIFKVLKNKITTTDLELYNDSFFVVLKQFLNDSIKKILKYFDINYSVKNEIILKKKLLELNLHEFINSLYYNKIQFLDTVEINREGEYGEEEEEDYYTTVIPDFFEHDIRNLLSIDIKTDYNLWKYYYKNLLKEIKDFGIENPRKELQFVLDRYSDDYFLFEEILKNTNTPINTRHINSIGSIRTFRENNLKVIHNVGSYTRRNRKDIVNFWKNLNDGKFDVVSATVIKKGRKIPKFRAKGTINISFKDDAEIISYFPNDSYTKRISQGKLVYLHSYEINDINKAIQIEKQIEDNYHSELLVRFQPQFIDTCEIIDLYIPKNIKELQSIYGFKIKRFELNSKNRIELKETIDGFNPDFPVYNQLHELGLNKNGKNVEIKTKTKEQADKTLDTFLTKWIKDKLGVSISEDTSDNLGGAIAHADIISKLIKVAKGEAKADTLPEEVGHFIFEAMSKEKQKELLSLAKKTELYKQVVQDYKGIYTKSEDYAKETAGQLIGLHITNKWNEVTNKSQDKTLLAKVYNYITKAIKSLYDKLNAVIGNPIQREVSRIYSEVAEEVFGETKNITEMNLEDSIERYKDTELASIFLQKGEKSYIDEIQKESTARGIELVGDDTDESKYKDNKGNLFNRLTEFITKAFSTTRTPQESAKRHVDKVFKEKGLTHDSEIEYYTDKTKETYTYDELIAKKLVDYETERVEGKIKHLMMQKVVSTATAKADIDNEIRVLAQEKEGVQNAINIDNLEWINKESTIEKLFYNLGINIFSNIDDEIKDKIVAEIPMVSDDLGIGTKPDYIVEHSNHDLSLIDFKFGKGFYNDSYITNILKYSEKCISDVYDHKVNKAKLELALRAMMIKEQHPDVHFRSIAVAHINKEGEVSVENVEMGLYLEFIRQYLKDKSNGKRDVYEKYNKRGLFDETEYGGTSGSLMDISNELNKLTYEEKIKDQEAKLNQMLYRLEFSKDLSPRNRELLKKKIAKKYELLEELKKDKGKDMNTNKHDMSVVKRAFGTLYDSSDPKIQMFAKTLFGAKQRARDEFREYRRKSNKLLTDVYNEYKSTHSGSNIKNIPVIGDFLKGANYGDIYKFMRDWKETADDTGYVTPTTRSYKDKQGKIYTMTDAQWAYNKFQREEAARYYLEIMSKKAYDEKTEEGKRYTVKMHELLNKPETLAKDFMPRVPMDASEIRERFGIFSKKALDNEKNKYLTHYNDIYTYGDGTTKHRVPIKYMGGQRIMEEELYTFSSELAFGGFIENLIMKKHLDDVGSFGTALKMHLGIKEQNGNDDGWKESIRFVEDNLKFHIVGKKYRTKLTRKPIVIKTYTDKEGNTKRIAIDTSKLMNQAKMYLSYSLMGLKVVAPAVNTALVIMLTTKDAVKGSIAKSLGIPEEEIDFTLKDLKNASMDYSSMQKDIWSNNQEKNKLHAFAKKFHYLADNYDYKIRPKDQIIAKNRFGDTSWIFFTYRMGEDFGQFAILAAQIRRMKTKDKEGNTISMWDAYDFDEEGKFVYTGGNRGFVKHEGDNVEEIGEITTEEMIRLKRVYQRIHGNYRQDEKMMIEMTAEGSWLMNYKRYMPAYMIGLFGGKQKDSSLGYFKPKMIINEDGTVMPKKLDGETELEFVDRIHRQKFDLLFGMLHTYSKMALNTFGTKFNINEDYTLKGMSNEEKQKMIDILLTLSIMSTFIAGYNYDDDDDNVKTPLEERLRRLFVEDITQGANPQDFLRNMATPVVMVSKMFDMSMAFTKFIGQGIIQGERTKEGKIPGGTTFRKTTPIFSVLAEIDKYFKEDVKESDVKTLFGYYDSARNK